MQSPPLVPDHAPKVSIHIPAYREPPEMLKQTLDAVARLDYPNFECVVVINNTPDPAHWMPIEEHCRLLGDRFKFVRADNLQGFKAGALRLAMVHTAADAEVLGILDADYVVHPDWLKDLVPLFADQSVGLVQAPQDHRDDSRSVMHHAMGCTRATASRSGLAMPRRLGNRSEKRMNNEVMMVKDARNPTVCAVLLESHSSIRALKYGLRAPSPTMPPRMATAFCPICTTVK